MSNFRSVLAFCAMTFAFSCTKDTANSSLSKLDGRPKSWAKLPDFERSEYEAASKDFMVVSQGRATTAAAHEILSKGGNVIDAAVAASFAIAVERPQSTGLAGGGFMLLHLAGKTPVDLALDFREMAPRKAHQKMFQDKQANVIAGKSTEGAQASGVPGMVAGVIAAHQRYGKLPLATVMAPAIRLAREGFPVYAHLHNAMQSQREVLAKSIAGRSIYLNENAQPLALGSILKQPELARVLETIAEEKAKGFYKGWVADAMIAEQRRLGGLIDQQDLNTYAVKWRQPLRAKFGKYEVMTMPPPSSGGVHVIEILNIIKGLNLSNPDSANTIHATSTAMQMAFADRAKYLGDTDFVKVPLQTLSSDTYASKWRSKIPANRAIPSRELARPVIPGYDSKETTHFSIADKNGNVVSSTQTINGWFGSGVVVPGTGLVMNNQMDDFVAKPGVPNKFGAVGNAQNEIRAKKRPLSSMSPTIVLENKKPVMALGSPAGTQIISCVSLTILNYLNYNRSLFDSVAAIRYHHQWLPDELVVEAPGFEPEVKTKLEAMGHKIVESGIGCKVQAIAFTKQGLLGASDPRGEGLAAGEGHILRNSPKKGAVGAAPVAD